MTESYPSRTFLFLAILALMFTASLQAQSLDLNDPNITFKDKEGKILPLDSIRTLVAKGSFSMKEKKLPNGKSEVTLIPISSNNNNLHSNIGDEWIKKWKGKKFPEFKLTGQNGKILGSDNFKGKYSVINFWFIHCKPCVQEMPDLNKLVKKYKEQPVQFLAPALDTRSSIVTFLEKNDFDYTILPDAKNLANDMALRIYPAHLLVNKEGIIEEILIGGSEDIFEKLDQMLSKRLAKN